MDCQCFIQDDEGSNLSERIAAFVSDRSLGAVTGPRRFGRDAMVDLVAEAARAAGLRVAVAPGGFVESPDVLIFRHWKDIDEALVASLPSVDVLYGQDLCHQVPSVVRVFKCRGLRSGSQNR